MEENKPPFASIKLKQAKLSFFKSTPVSVKSNMIGQGKKRKTSSSNCLDSPTKSKACKPFNLIALDNTECTKAHKIRKISFAKTSDGNDHEVSSSSEAEAGNVKSSNGNFMDRFVRKLPVDGQQEISSTNEMFEIAQLGELPVDEPESATDDQAKVENLLQLETTDVLDCIIIDDSEESFEVGITASSDKQTPCETPSCRPSKSDSKLPGNFSEIDTQKEINILNADMNSTINENLEKEKHNSTQNVESSAFDAKCSFENKDNGVKSEETLNDSAKDISAVPSFENKDDSVISEGTLNDSAKDISAVPSFENKDDSVISEETLNDSVRDISSLPTECSTPIKSGSSNESGAEVSLDVSAFSTPNTSATSSGKKARKVNSGSKKVEKDVMKLKMQNEKLDRKRKLESEKTERERIKREKKETKEKQRQEQKEKLEREKLEKERAKEEDRRKKEEERIKKEEDKKKKQAAIEAKQEEKRKKEDEKKQKEEDKLREEEEKKKKEQKTKQAFQSFFIKPKDINVKSTNSKPSTGIFIPFELKKDMHLAPALRRVALTEDKKENLDEILANAETCVNTYLKQLKHGDITPHKTGNILRKNPKPEEEVQVIHDSEALQKVMHHVKLLQFHMDYRPPYYGTWRKRPALSARNPWKKDESLLDYDVDSDEEWEEEEPGESLSCSDGEEDKGEEVDEDEDDGFVVPHGYLSEDEGCNEDDEINPEKLKLQQLAIAKAWDEELKRKLHAAPVKTVACFFENSPSSKMMGDVRLLYEFKAVVLVPTPIHTSLFSCSEPEKLDETVSDGTSTTPNQKGLKKMTVPDEAMHDLIRLVHGNTCGIKRLIREFRVYWLRKSNSTTVNDKDSPSETGRFEDSFVENNLDISSSLNEPMNESLNVADSDEQMGEKGNNSNDNKVREEGYGCNISKRQLDLKITSMAVRAKRPGFIKTCWYVHENILAQFNMSDITLPNSWVHLLPVPVRTPFLNTSKIVESPVLGASKVTKSDRTNKAVDSPVPRVQKIVNILAQSSISTTDNSELPAELKDNDRVEGKETPLKRAANDQRSIKDFALSKHELLNQPAKAITEDSPKIKAIAQKTPKGKNKINSQKCIMDFAKMIGSKKSLASSPALPQRTSNTPCSENIEVIDVDSNSMVEFTSSFVESSQASEVTVSAALKCSFVEPREEPSSETLKCSFVALQDDQASDTLKCSFVAPQEEPSSETLKCSFVALQDEPASDALKCSFVAPQEEPASEELKCSFVALQDEPASETLKCSFVEPQEEPASETLKCSFVALQEEKCSFVAPQEEPASEELKCSFVALQDEPASETLKCLFVEPQEEPASETLKCSFVALQEEKCSFVAPQEVQPSLDLGLLASSETLTKILPNNNNVEAMEVDDIQATDISQGKSSVESQKTVDNVGKASHEVECIVID